MSRPRVHSASNVAWARRARWSLASLRGAATAAIARRSGLAIVVALPLAASACGEEREVLALRPERFGQLVDLDRGAEAVYFARTHKTGDGARAIELWCEVAGSDELGHAGDLTVPSTLADLVPIAITSRAATGGAEQARHLVALAVSLDGAPQLLVSDLTSGAVHERLPLDLLGSVLASVDAVALMVGEREARVLVSSWEQRATRVLHAAFSLRVADAGGPCAAEPLGLLSTYEGGFAPRLLYDDGEDVGVLFGTERGAVVGCARRSIESVPQVPMRSREMRDFVAMSAFGIVRALGRGEIPRRDASFLQIGDPVVASRQRAYVELALGAGGPADLDRPTLVLGFSDRNGWDEVALRDPTAAMRASVESTSWDGPPPWLALTASDGTCRLRALVVRDADAKTPGVAARVGGASLRELGSWPAREILGRPARSLSHGD